MTCNHLSETWECPTCGRRICSQCAYERPCCYASQPGVVDKLIRDMLPADAVVLSTKVETDNEVGIIMYEATFFEPAKN